MGSSVTLVICVAITAVCGVWGNPVDDLCVVHSLWANHMRVTTTSRG